MRVSQHDGSHKSARHSPPLRLHDHTGEQTRRKPRIYPCGHWPAAKPRTVTQLIRIDPSVTSERALPTREYLCLCMYGSIRREGGGGGDGVSSSRRLYRAAIMTRATRVQIVLLESHLSCEGDEKANHAAKILSPSRTPL